jgi:hypothetical protein
VTPCLNCDGWGCAQCALDREEARGGEQGPTASELHIDHLRKELEVERLLRNVAEKERDVAVAERNLVWIEWAKLKGRFTSLLERLGGGA